MKLLYIAKIYDLASSIGVLKKINNQKLALSRKIQELDVIIFYHTGYTNLISSEFGSEFTFRYFDHSKFKSIYHQNKLWLEIEHEIHAFESGIVYFRYPGASFFLYRLLKRFPSKIIFEHNSKEIEELKLNSKFSNIRIWFEFLYARKGFRYSLGHVGKAKEFAYHQEFKTGYKLRLKTVTNGVDVQNLRKKKQILLSNDERIRLLFVGNISKWHGLERLLRGMKNYCGPEKYSLYLVGDKYRFHGLIEKYGLSDKINNQLFLTGFKSGEALDNIFDQCHFAIGSLGLHRIDIKSGAPLKHREYLSRGIPFIYSGGDDDIEDNLNTILLNVPPNEEPIDLEYMLGFIRRVYSSNQSIPDVLREFAMCRVDESVKTLELVDFLQSCNLQD